MPGAKDPTPLTFTFKNIGPIKDAELELGDLTIVAGRNNTGKTYLAYTLYGFLTTWEDWPGPALRTRKAGAAERSRRSERYPAFEQISEQVEENGQAEVLVDRAALSRERREANRRPDPEVLRGRAGGRVQCLTREVRERFHRPEAGH